VSTTAEDHLGLVGYAVKHFTPTLPDYVDTDDLFQEGALGLTRAAPRFDPTKGTQFCTYALRRIRGQMLDSLSNLDPLPKEVRSKAKRGELEDEHIWDGRAIPIEFARDLADPRSGSDLSYRWLPSARRSLQRGLAALSDEERRLLALWYHEEIGPTGIARLLGSTAGKIRRRHAALIGTLRQSVFPGTPGGFEL
jgi:RNA polymerase sigma factor (sigma-70 family)